jgi:hypothetical protein
MRRLTASQVKPLRVAMLNTQEGRCALCALPLPVDKSVLDHDHATGAVRGVLHRGCNALLGKIENNAARYGVANIAAFTNGVAGYLRNHMTNVTGYLHPTHKTDEEKRLLRNKRARVARQKRKES